MHKAGGPEMVVTNVGTYEGTSTTYVSARWWDGKEFKGDSFDPVELKKI